MPDFHRIKSFFGVLLLAATLVLPSCDAQSHTESRKYADDEIAYFVEVALGSEFGSSSAVVRKWVQNVKVQLLGIPTPEDRQTLQDVVGELNELVDDVSFTVVDENPNVEMHVVPSSEFAAIESNYVPGNLGFFWVNWSGASTIYRARILIATDIVTQKQRSHLMREELTQSLGLMNDSNRYPESIFYQGWTDVTAYTPLDRKLIEMLYDPAVKPGMDEDRVVAALESL